jgi:isopenicillin-N epimerase
VFITNTTTAINTIARSLPLGPHDEILTTDHEYGACDNAWNFVCGQAGAVYRPVHIPIPYPGDDAFIDLICSAITPRTRILYLSHITSTTALIFPIEAICRIAREKGILTVIDGAHVPGHISLRLDALGADFYAGNCHKWLCAPKGSAFFYARPEHHEVLHGLVISWGYSTGVTGHTSFDAYTGDSVFIRRHQWQGTRDISAFLSVPAAIEFQEKRQWHTIRRQCHDLAVKTMRRIAGFTGMALPGPDESFGQMIIIPVPSCDPEILKSTLYDTYRIEIPITVFRDNIFVRASFQQYNTVEDAEKLIGAIRDIFK